MKKIKYPLSVIIIVSTVIFGTLIVNSVLKSKLLDKYIFDSNTKDNIELIITPEYNEYFVNQDVWIKIKLVNNSRTDYYLKYPFHYVGFQYSITDPLNEIRYENPTDDYITPMDSAKLSPGGYIERITPLNMIFEKFLSYEKKKLGIYKVAITYQNTISNLLEINLIEPTGVDKEIFDLTYNGLFVSNESDESKSKKLEELFEKYPSNRYAPQLYDILLANLPRNDGNRYLQNINKYFEKNSNAYGSKYIIDWFEKYLEIYIKLTDGQINLKLEELSNKYQGTNTSFIINQMREEKILKK